MLDLGLDGVHVCVTGSNGGIGQSCLTLLLISESQDTMSILTSTS